jgi:hypothetical protein
MRACLGLSGRQRLGRHGLHQHQRWSLRAQQAFHSSQSSCEGTAHATSAMSDDAFRDTRIALVREALERERRHLEHLTEQVQDARRMGWKEIEQLAIDFIAMAHSRIALLEEELQRVVQEVRGSRARH